GQLSAVSGQPKQERGISGTVEAMSTCHKPWGLMTKVIEKAKENETKVFKWCLLEVLEKCPDWRECNSCKLDPDCRGLAKTKCNGFFSIEDALRLKKRVSVEAWKSEVMCQRPSATGAVFTTFDVDVHVIGE